MPKAAALFNWPPVCGKEDLYADLVNTLITDTSTSQRILCKKVEIVYIKIMPNDMCFYGLLS